MASSRSHATWRTCFPTLVAVGLGCACAVLVTLSIPVGRLLDFSEAGYIWFHAAFVAGAAVFALVVMRSSRFTLRSFGLAPVTKKHLLAFGVPLLVGILLRGIAAAFSP